MGLALTVDAELQGRVAVGSFELDGVSVRERSEGLDAELAALASGLQARYAGQPSSSVPGVEAARTLYKRVGLDPTKTRPSNEALLRRVLKGEALYHVNTLVDALNLCSLREQIPFGLYDRARLEPPVLLRLGAPGEGYEGIRKGRIQIEGKLALFDGQGPFGNPSADSLRTSITLEAKDVLVVAFAPAELAGARLAAVLDATAATLIAHSGGRRAA